MYVAHAVSILVFFDVFDSSRTNAATSAPIILPSFHCITHCPFLLMIFSHTANYQTIKWVRYITNAGRYEIRI